MICGNPKLMQVSIRMGCMLSTCVSICWAGPLEDYLKHPPEFENRPWSQDDRPEIAIPRWTKLLKEGKPDKERAIAVGNLAGVADSMANVPEAQAAAMELMDQHVMPNVAVTKRVDRTLFCSWRGTLLDCVNVYKKLGNRKAERDCLELFINGAELPKDQDFGIYLLAHHLAAEENYAEALITMQRLRDGGSMSASKKFLMSKWSKKMAWMEREAAKKLKPAPAPKESKNEPLPK
jgi:hypothetical protein